MIYVVGLTLLAAAIVGVVPALKATGRHVHTRLQTLSPGSGSRMQMGRLWTALIVAQVAVTVAMLPMAMYFAWSSLRLQSGGGYASAEFLSASLSLDRTLAPPTDAGDKAFTARYGDALAEIERRLTDDSRVREVTFSMASPGRELAVVLEAEGLPVPVDAVNYNIVEGTKRGTLVRFNRVATNFFSAFDVPVSFGRDLAAPDASADAAGVTPGVLVSRGLVDQVFSGSSPLGRRIKYVGRSREAPSRNVVLERWYEIVGVVPDFPVPGLFDDESEGQVYHAVAAGDLYPARLSARARTGDPAALADPLRNLSASIDPDVQLLDVSTAEIAFKQAQGMMRLIGVSLAGATPVAAATPTFNNNFPVVFRPSRPDVRSAASDSGYVPGDAHLDDAGRDVLEHVADAPEQFLTVEQVVGQARARQEQRAARVEDRRIEGRHRAARLAEERHRAARAQHAQALVERRLADRIVDDVDAAAVGEPLHFDLEVLRRVEDGLVGAEVAHLARLVFGRHRAEDARAEVLGHLHDEPAESRPRPHARGTCRRP